MEQPAHQAVMNKKKILVLFTAVSVMAITVSFFFILLHPTNPLNALFFLQKEYLALWVAIAFYSFVTSLLLTKESFNQGRFLVTFFALFGWVFGLLTIPSLGDAWEGATFSEILMKYLIIGGIFITPLGLISFLLKSLYKNRPLFEKYAYIGGILFCTTLTLIFASLTLFSLTF